MADPVESSVSVNDTVTQGSKPVDTVTVQAGGASAYRQTVALGDRADGAQLAPVSSAGGLRVDQGVEAATGLHVIDLLLQILVESKIQTAILAQTFYVSDADVTSMRTDLSLPTRQ